MKKLLLSLGLATSVVSPIAVVISCGEEEQAAPPQIKEVGFEGLANFLQQVPSELHSSMLDSELTNIVGSLKKNDEVDLTKVGLEAEVLSHFEPTEGIDVELNVERAYTNNPNLQIPSNELLITLTVISQADKDVVRAKTISLVPNPGYNMASSTSTANGRTYTSAKNAHDLQKDMGAVTTVTPELIGIRDINFGRGITVVYTIDQAYAGAPQMTVHFVLTNPDEAQTFNNTGSFTVVAGTGPNREDLQPKIANLFTSPYHSTMRASVLRNMIGTTEIFSPSDAARRWGVSNLPTAPAGLKVEYHISEPFNGKVLKVKAVFTKITNDPVENNTVDFEVKPAPEPIDISAQIAGVYPLKMDSTFLQTELVQNLVPEQQTPAGGYILPFAKGPTVLGVTNPVLPAGLQVEYVIDEYAGEASIQVTAVFTKTDGTPVQAAGSSARFTFLMRAIDLGAELDKFDATVLSSTLSMATMDFTKVAVGQVVTAADLGITEPATLDSGITKKTYTVKTIGPGNVTVVAKFEKDPKNSVGGDAVIEKDLTVTLAP